MYDRKNVSVNLTAAGLDPHQNTGPNEAANHEAGLMLTGRTDQTDEPERRP